MSRLVAALAVLAFAFAATASAFSNEDRQIPMSDGVRIAATYYVPDGAPPSGGRPAVMLLHGLGGSRTAQSSGNLLYLTGVPRSSRLVVGPARLSVPLMAKPISG